MKGIPRVILPEEPDLKGNISQLGGKFPWHAYTIGSFPGLPDFCFSVCFQNNTQSGRAQKKKNGEGLGTPIT